MYECNTLSEDTYWTNIAEFSIIFINIILLRQLGLQDFLSTPVWDSTHVGGSHCTYEVYQGST